MPAPFHIAVVDPGARVPELDNYNRLVLQNPEVRFTYHLPALFGMSSLRFLSQQPDAIIVFGSSSSVNEELAWQDELGPWLKAQTDRKTPTLGICYGHQLLARVYGGQVGFALPTQEKYKGLREVRFLKSGFWDMEDGRFIVSHREIVTKLPDGFEACAQSPESSFEMMRHRTLPIWGTQFHPEAGPEFIENSTIPLEAGDHEPFRSGDQFMRRFIRLVSRS